MTSSQSNTDRHSHPAPLTEDPLRHRETITRSSEETIELGRSLAAELRPPCVVILEGELGSGKTTLVKGIAAGLGAAKEEEVTSPSFTLVHEYGRDRKVYHVDLYRVEGAREASSLGLEEMFEQPAVVLIEWGEKLNLAGPAVRIKLKHLGGDLRQVVVSRE